MNEYKCPKCGAEFSLGARFCQKCGCDFMIEFMDKPTETKTFVGKYPKASVGNRLLAYIIDRIVRLVLAIPAIIFFVIGKNMSGYSNWLDWPGARFQGEGWPFLIIAAFCLLLPLIYVFIKDGLWQGQSLGKKAMGLMVVYLPTNTPCTIGQSCLRTIVWKLVNLIPLFGAFIEPIMVLADENGRRLADKAANTQVIEVSRYICQK